MTWLPWLALSAAVVLVPLPSVAARRVLGLARRGRLGASGGSARRESIVRPPASALWLFWGGAWAAAGVGLGGAALGVAAAVAAATTAMMISAALARRREGRRRRGLLGAIRMVVAELAAGSRADSALGAAVAVAPEHAAVLAAAASAARSGADVSDVLLSSGVGELEPVAHAWRVASRAGAPLAAVLGRVAADLADQDSQHRAVSVALAGPRSSAVLLAGLPVVGISLGAAMGARPLPILLESSAGRMLCCVGVLLDAAGVIWTQSLMQRAQRP